MANDLDHVRSLAASDSLAVLTTTRPDGTIHASVVNAGVVDDPVGGDPRVGLVAAARPGSCTICRVSGRATVVFRHGPTGSQSRARSA